MENPNAQTPPVRLEAIVPNPKKKLLDQVREVARLKHYAIRRSLCRNGRGPRPMVCCRRRSQRMEWEARIFEPSAFSL